MEGGRTQEPRRSKWLRVRVLIIMMWMLRWSGEEADDWCGEGYGEADGA